MKFWILGAAGLVAAGTGLGAITGNLAAQQLSEDMRPLAGQYESEISVISIDIPDAPPEMAQLLRQGLGSSTSYCLTEEEVEESFRSILNRGQQDGCTYTRFSAVGGRIDAELVCDGEAGPMTMQMEGTGSPTSSDVTMTMSGDMGMGPSTIKMRVVSTRTGAC